MPHPQSYVEIPKPNLIVFVGRAFGRGLGLEGGTLVNGIRALMRETPTELPL